MFLVENPGYLEVLICGSELLLNFMNVDVLIVFQASYWEVN